MKRPKAPSVDLKELVEVEVRLLDRVCRDGPYHSVVMLAADEWRGSGDWLVGSIDAVMWVVYGLCDQGLLILREAVGKDDHGLPITYIRATPEAWDLLGYGPPVRDTSHWGSGTDPPMNPGDPTEFRNYTETAQGGPIERLSFEEHMSVYPTHTFHKR